MSRHPFHASSESSAAQPRRHSRPLTRAQEFAVLAVVFGLGAALQLAYVLHSALLP